MRSCILFLSLLFLDGQIQAQNGWSRITDATNPITHFSAAGMYHGAAWVDVNNDGLVDLFAAPNGLFINLGKGQFKADTNSLGILRKQNPSGCSWADLDNDGDLDVVLAQFPSAVYLNEGAGKFLNITNRFPGLANYAAWGCAIGDINNDQRLDVLLVHANRFHPPTATRLPCKLFVQATDSLHFTTVTGYAFTDSLGAYTVPYWADYDLDGDQDLFIASGAVKTARLDFCYRNTGLSQASSQLERLSLEAFAAQPQDGQCYNFVDIDNDGDLDVCLTNYQSVPTQLYINQGGQYVATTTPFTKVAHHLSNCWGDFDNDGDQDVFFTSDSLATTYYRNEGGTFVATPTFEGPAGAAGLVAGDFDNDGDLDVFIAGQSTAPVAQGLYRNETMGNGRNWVNLKLVGTRSNRSALGARILLKSMLNGHSTWQLRTVSAQNSFQGQNDLRVHFGLNKASVIDSLVVVWPSGNRQSFASLLPNQFYTITEGSDLVTALVNPASPYSLVLPVTSPPMHRKVQSSHFHRVNRRKS